MTEVDYMRILEKNAAQYAIKGFRIVAQRERMSQLEKGGERSGCLLVALILFFFPAAIVYYLWTRKKYVLVEVNDGGSVSVTESGGFDNKVGYAAGAVGVVVTLVIVVSVASSGGSGSATSTQTDAQPETEGGVRPDPTPTPAPVQVSATDLTSAFDENKVRALRQYEGKLLEVTGIVSNIDDRSFSLEGHELFRSVRASVPATDDCQDCLASLSKGQQVSVKGRYSDDFLGGINIKDVKCPAS